MRGLFAFGFALSAAASLLASSAVAAPSADVYGSKPDISDVVISPDGAHVAMLTASGDAGGLRILALAGGQCTFASETVKLRDVFWANAQRLVLRVSFTFIPTWAQGDSRYASEVVRYISVSPNCQDAKPLLSDHKDVGRLASFRFVGRAVGGKQLLFTALNIQEKDDQVGSNIKVKDRTSLDVYTVDPTTGESERLEFGTARTADWISDGEGRLRIRVDIDERSRRETVFARIGASNDWQRVYEGDPENDPAHAIDFVAMGNTADTAFVVTRNGGDRRAIYEFDLKAKALGRLVFQHPRVDVGLRLDAYSRQAVGAIYTNDYPEAEFFDRGYAQMQADLAATFPGERVAIVSVNADRKKYIAYAEGPQNPTGAYHVVDMTEPSISLIGPRYPAIAASDVGQVKAFTYKARDGLTIPAYLTLPPGSTGKNLPLVVMPHGGPASRDDASFDTWAQFIASRGYAVLQPQFRGSSGFGASHLKAGHFKWGLEMQNDISDGVKFLTGNGTVDPARVCIFGWSYGGYAAMAGLAFTPELYKCGIAGAGVSDLPLFVGDLRRESPRYHLAGDSWRKFIGDPASESERLKATSPIRRVDNIKAPLLLIHGKDDTVVPFKQSSMMADAMKAAGKPVEFVVLDSEDHWLSKASTSRRVLHEIEAFLALWLPPAGPLQSPNGQSR